MAKQTPDQSKLDPYREVVILHDTKNGAVTAIGSINEKTFKHSEVPPISSNRQQFMEVKKTSIVRNFINNLTKQANEPYRFSFYIVPEKAIPEVVDNLYKLNEDDKDQDARKAIQPYRTSGRQLDRVKFDKSEIPFEMISNMTGMPRSEIEKNIVPVMEGKPFPEIISVNYKLQDGVTLSGGQSFRMHRDENGIAGADFFSPKPRPEFDEPKWAQEFTPEEKSRMASQKPLDRLIGFENPRTGQREYCFVKFDPLTNHLEPVHPRDVKMEEWAFRSKLDDTKMSELALGHKVFIDNGKVGPEKAEFSGNIQYDPYQERFVASEMKFAKPFIPQHIKDQLNADQYSKLVNYEAIDGRGIKGRSGENYSSDIRVSKQTNSLEWGNFSGQNQSQSQNRGQSQEGNTAKSQQQDQGAGQWPENEAHQSQGRGQGPQM